MVAAFDVESEWCGKTVTLPGALSVSVPLSACGARSRDETHEQMFSASFWGGPVHKVQCRGLPSSGRVGRRRRLGLVPRRLASPS